MNDHSLFRDMLEQPHLLILGATGTGKSVLINGLIYEALSAPPERVRLILIDPKRIELYEYRNLPHVMRYTDTASGAVDALEEVVKVMDRRFQALQASGTKKWHGSSIYVIIDELADIMTTNKKQFAPLLQRVIQLGRAAAIHVIAATQCTLASCVLPTAIKCNFSSRVGLRTATARDSRNIIDASGCELLAPYGEAIYRHGIETEKVKIPLIPDAMRRERIGTWTTEELKLYKGA